MPAIGPLNSQKDLENMMDPLGWNCDFNVPTSIHSQAFEPADDNDEIEMMLDQRIDRFIQEHNSTPRVAYSNLINGTPGA